MPNLVLEYTNSVDERVNMQGLLEDLHQVALDSGLFRSIDIKSRALRCHHWLIGELGDSEDFINVTFELLEGRTDEQKRQLAEKLKDVLLDKASNVKSLSVNVRDMDKNAFQKILT